MSQTPSPLPAHSPELPFIIKAFAFLEDLGFTSLGYTGQWDFQCVSYSKGTLGIDVGISMEFGSRLQLIITHRQPPRKWTPLDRDFVLDCERLGVSPPTVNGPFNFPVKEPLFHEALAQHARALREVLTHPSFDPVWNYR